MDTNCKPVTTSLLPAYRLTRDTLLSSGDVVLSSVKDRQTQRDGKVRVIFFDKDNAIRTRRVEKNALIEIVNI